MYRCGIETDLYQHMTYRQQSINCTVVELKQGYVYWNSSFFTSINCTVVELKHREIAQMNNEFNGINCTVVELKPESI